MLNLLWFRRNNQSDAFCERGFFIVWNFRCKQVNVAKFYPMKIPPKNPCYYDSTAYNFAGKYRWIALIFCRISHGTVKAHHEPPFYSGAELVFHCLPGFEIQRIGHVRHNRLVCQDTGRWAPPRSYQTPKCFPIQCSPPANDPFGRIVTQLPVKLSYNTTLDIICIPGYQLPNGNRHQIVRCNEDRTWVNVNNQGLRSR